MVVEKELTIKRPFKFKPLEKEIFEKWFEDNIGFDSLSLVDLNTLHQAYQIYVHQKTGTVPLTKKKV